MTGERDTRSQAAPPSNVLKTVATAAVVISAVASITLLQLAGRNNKSMLLRIAMSIWVLGPFVALWLANVAWKRWSIARWPLLYGMMITVAAACVLVYGDKRFHPASAPNVFLFVMIPPVFTAVIAVIVALAYATRPSARR